MALEVRSQNHININNPVNKVKVTQEYNKLLETAKSVMVKTAATYVPELCALLRDANPNLSNHEIRKQVQDDCYGIWAWDTVTKYWPEWIKDPTKVMMAKERFAKQRQLKQINDTFRAIPKTEPEDFDEPIDIDFLKRQDQIREHIIPFKPSMLAEKYETEEYYQYKPTDIIDLSNALQKAIGKYFPIERESPKKNVIHIVDRWNMQERSRVYESLAATKTQVDALYNILKKSMDNQLSKS